MAARLRPQNGLDQDGFPYVRKATAGSVSSRDRLAYMLTKMVLSIFRETVTL